MSEKIWYLKTSQLFESLSDDEIRRIEGVSRAKKVSRGSPVYLPADAADGVLLLASGRVKICHLTPEGKQSILAFIEPGEVFGELALLEQASRDEYAEAVENSLVMLIPNREIELLMQLHPRISMSITRLYGLRRKRIERRLKYLLFRSNRERLIHLLLELSEKYARRVDDGLELSIKLSHQDMANMIGSTRESVTVLLGELQNEELIRLARRRVTIRSIEKMAESVSALAPKIENSPKSPNEIASYG